MYKELSGVVGRQLARQTDGSVSAQQIVETNREGEEEVQNADSPRIIDY